MKKPLLILLALLSIFSFAYILFMNKHKTEVVTENLQYEYRRVNFGLVLSLNDNNKFRYKYYNFGKKGGGEIAEIIGNYTKSKSKLHLIPDSIFLKVMKDESFTDYEMFKLKYKDDSLLIKTDYDIIRWNTKQYLISPQISYKYKYYPFRIYNSDMVLDSIADRMNDYHEFSTYCNSGSEPKYHGIYLVQKKDVFEDSMEIFSVDKIPQEWQYLFLEKPISAKVIKTVENKYSIYFDDTEEEIIYYHITMDKGSNDNIRVGLFLFNKEYKDYITINNVNPNSSTGLAWSVFEKDEVLMTDWTKK